MTPDHAKVVARKLLDDMRAKLLTPLEPEERGALDEEVVALSLLLDPDEDSLVAEANRAAEGSDWDSALDGLDRVDCFADGYVAGALRDPTRYARKS